MYADFYINGDQEIKYEHTQTHFGENKETCETM